MRPLVKLTYQLNVKEGDFRFGHARLREYSESVTFYNGQEEEKARAERVFDGLYNVYRRYIRAQFPVRSLNFFQNIFSSVFGFSLMGLQIVLTGKFGAAQATYKTVITAIGLVGTLAAGLSSVPQYFTNSAQMAGYAHRVGQMLDKLADLLNTYEHEDADLQYLSGEEVAIRGLRCRTPGGEVLFRDMTFNVPRGQSLLIYGPSGSGKSSLLRIIGGLWPIERGLITRPEGTKGMFFVPQRPYIFQGTLRENLLYPDGERSAMMDADVDALLTELDLKDVVTRFAGGLDEEAPWPDMLSGGEQQRLGLARMLLQRPAYAVCDESTSALDQPLEKRCMDMCNARGITLISVGHRPTLLLHHENVLRLDGKGGYSVHPSREDPLWAMANAWDSTGEA
jgi:putative ATP-binding cassette transporter